MLATMAMVGNNQILCLMVIGRSLPVVGFAAHDSRHGPTAKVDGHTESVK
jgi:hypothetical protein